MNYHLLNNCDVLNGDGCRVSLWVSGCEIGCRGCHNKNTWDFCSGIVFDDEAEELFFNYLANPYITGSTFSGGHPLAPKNIDKITKLMRKQKELYPSKTIWCWTGLLYEDLFNNSTPYECLKYIDVLVDGEFVVDLHDKQLKLRGSSNQRVIDVQKSLQQYEVILYIK